MQIKIEIRNCPPDVDITIEFPGGYPKPLPRTQAVEAASEPRKPETQTHTNETPQPGVSANTANQE